MKNEKYRLKRRSIKNNKQKKKSPKDVFFENCLPNKTIVRGIYYFPGKSSQYICTRYYIKISAFGLNMILRISKKKKNNV